MKRDLMCFLLFRDKEDEHQCTDEQQEWVEQIGDVWEAVTLCPSSVTAVMATSICAP